MKKICTVLLAFALVIGMAFLSCDSGGSSSSSGPKNFSLVLADDFEYGDSYQGQVQATRYISGKITNEEVYILKFDFVPSRDFEDGELSVVLVDPREEAGYWDELSDTETWYEGGLVEQGESYSVELEITATKTAAVSSGAGNIIAISTPGVATYDAVLDHDVGDKGPVTLAITNFEFKRKPAAPPPPEPIIVTNPIVTKYGGLGEGSGTAGETHNYFATLQYAAALSYTFTTEQKAFDTVDIKITVERIAGDASVEFMKLILARPATATGWDGGWFYPQYDTDGTYTITRAMSDFSANGIVALTHNRTDYTGDYDDDDWPGDQPDPLDEVVSFTLVVDEIKFYNAD